jgi:hypothetical protein
MTYAFVVFDRRANTNILQIHQIEKKLISFPFDEKIINPIGTRFSKVEFIS